MLRILSTDGEGFNFDIRLIDRVERGQRLPPRSRSVAHWENQGRIASRGGVAA